LKGFSLEYGECTLVISERHINMGYTNCSIVYPKHTRERDVDRTIKMTYRLSTLDIIISELTRS
jgi:hypothetical protein